LRDIEFIHCDYSELVIPEKSIIYCDPPYLDTKKYKDDFDHDKFWEWCRQKAKGGHKVYISEYQAPDDFICIKEVVKKSTMDHSSTLKTTEKLFIFNEE
jgi:DNA adenine methylase